LNLSIHEHPDSTTINISQEIPMVKDIFRFIVSLEFRCPSSGY
jgi:hypothetical protein